MEEAACVYRLKRNTLKHSGIHRLISDNYVIKFVSDLQNSPGTPVSSATKTNRHDITEMLLKVALNTITPTTLLTLLEM